MSRRSSPTSNRHQRPGRVQLDPRDRAEAAEPDPAELNVSTPCPSNPSPSRADAESRPEHSIMPPDQRRNARPLSALLPHPEALITLDRLCIEGCPLSPGLCGRRSASTSTLLRASSIRCSEPLCGVGASRRTPGNFIESDLTALVATGTFFSGVPPTDGL
jgi:hypothetical protein